MWETFLTGWNGHSFFLNSSITPSPHMELFTDAASTIGFGGTLMGNGSREGGLPTWHLAKTKG